MVKINTNPDNELLNSYLRGDFNLFSVLVDEGQNINCLDEENNSLISIIIRNPDRKKDNKKFFNKLISAGVSLKQIGWEDDLLTTCVKYQNDLYYAKKLLKNEINIDATGITREKYDEDEYYDAPGYSHCDMFENFLTFRHGPPIFEALKSKKIEYFDLFLKNKADVQILDHHGDSILHFLIKECYARYSHKNFEKIFKTLLDYNIDHNLRDESGCDVLNIMSKYKMYHLFPAFFKKIKNIDVNTCDNHGRTPLIYSISSDDDLAMVTKSLIRKNANLDTFTLDGDNALTRSIKSNNFPTLKFLIENGANTMLVNMNGDTIMHTIAEYDNHIYDETFNKYYNIILKNNPELLLQKNNLGVSPLDILEKRKMIFDSKKEFINKFL